jgi:hypothetical protein
MSAALTESEQVKLRDLEGIIERGLQTFVEVGAALTLIREQRLYRTSHPTFDEYCKERWGWSRQRSAQLIGASEVVGALSTQVDNPPTNEAQARELIGVPEERRPEAWERAQEEAKDPEKPTRKEVKKAAAPYKPPASWKPERAEEAERALETLTEDEREAAVSMVDEPGIPDMIGLDMIQNVAAMEPAERKEVLDLHKSEDKRDRSKAKSIAAKKPPSPDPRCTILDDARLMTKRALKWCDRDPDPAFRERIEAAMTELAALSEDIHTATRSDAA